MTLVELALAVVKILIVILFLLNCGGLATWADRRQSAMIQHRVGPNRAVIHLPSAVVRVILFLPGVALGALGVLGLSGAATQASALEHTMLSVQLSILVVWFNLAILSAYVRGKGAVNKMEELVAQAPPRSIFYFGLGLHAAAFILIRALPPSVWFASARPLAVVLGVLISAAGFYAASRVPEGKIGLRAFGTLHSAADAVKLIFKEDFVPAKADRLLHALAPLISLFPALVTFAVIPFGDSICFADNNRNGIFEFGDLLTPVGSMARDGVCPGHVVPLQVVDLNVGLLFVFAIASTGVIGAAIAGWASDNKYALLGGLRAASQMISYEVAMGLSVVGVFLIYGSVRLGPMVEWQALYAWGIFVQPVAFFLFLACLAAENKRVPFDQPEGESEIVAGYFLEYSGMKFGMFMTAEYIEIFTSSALLVTLFFGGYSLPFLYSDGITIAFGESVLYQYKMNHLAVVLLSVAAFFSKVIFVAFVQIFFRWTLPRFRYDQLMRLGWTKLLPVAIGNLVITAVVYLAIESGPAGLISTLKLLGDVTKAVIFLAMIAAPAALVAHILSPVRRRRFLESSTARFAAAAGGVKAGPMQA